VIRLTDEQWERIRNHFPEENIADGRPTRIFGIYSLLHETIARFASAAGRPKSKQDACHYRLSDARAFGVFFNTATLLQRDKTESVRVLQRHNRPNGSISIHYQ
jgi:hypothetical protein